MAGKDNKVEAACSACRQRLRLPRHRVGTVVCPHCRSRFEADTNTVIINDANLGEVAIVPSSNITYRILKSKTNTGLFLTFVLFVILSPFLSISFLAAAYFNNWQQTYLHYATIFGALFCVSCLVLAIIGKRYYIDIEPGEIYSSELGVRIKYNNIDDIFQYLEQRYTRNSIVDQTSGYLRYTQDSLVPDPHGNVRELRITSSTGKSIDIGKDYMTQMASISDLIAGRVAMAKGIADYFELITECDKETGAVFRSRGKRAYL
jgi:hypothetical protein